MYESFELPVRINNETLHLPAQLVQTGYTHGFKVEVNSQEVLFEPDEEGSYRAVGKPEELDRSIRLELLQAIAEAIHSVLR